MKREAALDKFDFMQLFAIEVLNFKDYFKLNTKLLIKTRFKLTY